MRTGNLIQVCVSAAFADLKNQSRAEKEKKYE